MEDKVENVMVLFLDGGRENQKKIRYEIIKHSINYYLYDRNVQKSIKITFINYPDLKVEKDFKHFFLIYLWSKKKEFYDEIKKVFNIFNFYVKTTKDMENPYDQTKWKPLNFYRLSDIFDDVKSANRFDKFKPMTFESLDEHGKQEMFSEMIDGMKKRKIRLLDSDFTLKSVSGVVKQRSSRTFTEFLINYFVDFSNDKEKYVKRIKGYLTWKWFITLNSFIRVKEGLGIKYLIPKLLIIALHKTDLPTPNSPSKETFIPGFYYP